MGTMQAICTELFPRVLANIVKLLPTGTVFVPMFLNSLVTDQGNCQSSNKILTSILITACGFFCVFSCFTDSYKHSNDDKARYGIVTTSGQLWPLKNVVADDYKLKFSDFAHAFVSLLVYCVVVLLDPNTVNCLYSSLEIPGFVQKWLPLIVGAVSAVVSVCFPITRHGIGYHSNSNANGYVSLPASSR